MSLLLPLLSLLSTASAGEIQVITTVPVAVSINGQMLEYPEGSTAVTMPNLGEGTHLVEIRNLVGKLVTAVSVDLGVTEQVRLRYAKKALSEIGRGQLAPQVAVAPPPPPAAPQAPVPPAGTVTTTRTVTVQDQPVGDNVNVSLGIPGLGGVSIQAGGTVTGQQTTTTTVTTDAYGNVTGTAVGGMVGMAPGSFQLAGLPSAGTQVLLDGVALPYTIGPNAFAAPQVAAGNRRVVVLSGRGTLFDGVLAIQPGMQSICTWTGAVQCQQFPLQGAVVVQQPSVIVTQPVPAAPAAPVPMGPGPFSRLLAAVDDASFSDDKLDLLRTAVIDHHFSINQLGQLMDTLSFGDDKVDCAKLLRPRIVDPQNAFELGSKLTFSSDREEVLALFR